MATQDTNASTVSRAIAEEQHFVDDAYASLDREREYYTTQLVKVRAQGGGGTPGARRERDSFATHYEDNLIRLRNVENRLVLGRLDFTDESTTHIGRMTLRDSDQNILLVDWRAPQSEPFYQATALNPGDVVRRRHIQTRFRDVTSVEDELLTDVGDPDSLNLTGEGALFASMSQARDGKMGDIVATIQAEQDRIIRSSADGILVVQGGPGTGKTAVALHRAAYLLYTYRERMSRAGVLIIGPSPAFLRYIDQVLPSLGESDVVSTTIDHLLPGVEPTIADSDRAAEIKGRAVWAKIAERAVVKVLERPMTSPVEFRIDGYKLEITPKMVDRAQRKARRTGKTHNAAREVYAKKLVGQLAEQLAEAQDVDLSDNEWLYADVASSIDARREINRHWLPSSPQSLLERILNFPELLERAAPELSPDERAEIQRPKGHGFSSADIAILDEMAEHLGTFETDQQKYARASAKKDEQELSEYVSTAMESMDLGGGIVTSDKVVDHLQSGDSGLTLAERASGDRQWTYGHVVVDEAQELSPMQWRMVARRNPSRSMTVVGDLDQHPEGSPDGGWNAVLGAMAPYHREEILTISYRTPASLLTRAAETMRLAGHPVRDVRAARDLDDTFESLRVDQSSFADELARLVGNETDRLDSEYGAGGGTLAVIAPIGAKDGVASALRSDSALAQQLEPGSSSVGPRVVVIDPRDAKGLEFDAVVLTEPSQILRSGPGDLYVAMTRATRRMVVIGTEEPPAGLDETM